MSDRLAAALAFHPARRWCAMCKRHHHMSEFYGVDSVCAERRRIYSATARRRAKQRSNG